MENSNFNVLRNLKKFIKEKFSLLSIKETNQKFQLQLSSFKRALSFAYPYRWKVIIILSLTLLVAGLNVTEPLVMKFIFDGLQKKDAFPIIIKGIVFLIGLAVIKEIISGLTNYLTWKTRINIQYALTDATVEKIHRLPHDIHRNEGVGAIMTRLDRGIQGFIGSISEISFNVLPALAYLTMAIIAMIKLDFSLTLIAVGFTPIPVIIAALAAPNQTKREKHLLEHWVKLYSRFNEVLSGIVTVRSFAMEDAEKKRFLGGIQNANYVVVKGVKYDTSVSALQNIFITAARISVIAFGGMLAIKGKITLGSLVAFLGYIGGLFGPVQGLTGIYKYLRLASVSINQIFSILDEQDFIGDSPDAKDVVFHGSVHFDDIHFKYNTARSYLLKGVDLKIEKGETVAIVGPSGSGKTTLMALLMRFYDPTNGTVKIDGEDLRFIKQKSIRKQIAVVMQDALLFNESVRDNIAYGKPNATFEEIETAAITANAHDFIMKLEKGYNTLLGERGSRLSTGERQRIAIARAILKNAPILILDEATSALDAEVEFQIKAALERLIIGRTTFIIAHRLSTVVNADRILVLKNGRIIESGSHKDLLTGKGYYAELIDKQTRGLVEHLRN